MSDPLVLPPLLDVGAITIGALSGALHARRRSMDVVGVLTVATCAGIGGGAIRDVLLADGIPVFLVGRTYLATALLASVVGVVFATALGTVTSVLATVDTLLIGVWVTIGAQKALFAGLAPAAAMFLGLVTAIGGGVLRDLLCREPPSAFVPGRAYAFAALLASVAFVLVDGLDLPLWVTTGLAVGVASSVRITSVVFDWNTTASYDLWRWPRDQARTVTPPGSPE